VLWEIDRRPRPAAGDRRAALRRAAQRASWQAATFHRVYEHMERADALREMTVRYRELMHSNEPVHTWPLD
jgi:hypothetical protein